MLADPEQGLTLDAYLRFHLAKPRRSRGRTGRKHTFRLGPCDAALGTYTARCACAAIVAPLPCSVSYRFKRPDHIDILELAALTSLVKLLAQKGARRERILWCVDSRVVLGAVSKRRSSSSVPSPTTVSLRRSPSTCSGFPRGRETLRSES